MSLVTQASVEELERTFEFFKDRLVVEGRRFAGEYFWHQTDDRYVVFLAEFFLRRSNRTTVSRFLPQFLSKFPNPHSLIEASPDVVSNAARWAGFRTRTSRLPSILREFYSRDDWDATGLVQIPYIGEYAANGIALYVLGQPCFPVDGNVSRVVGRFFGVDEAGLDALLGEIKESLLSSEGVETFKAVHMGMLSLGWRACRVRPTCSQCPLAESCMERESIES